VQNTRAAQVLLATVFAEARTANDHRGANCFSSPVILIQLKLLPRCCEGHTRRYGENSKEQQEEGKTNSYSKSCRQTAEIVQTSFGSPSRLETRRARKELRRVSEEDDTPHGARRTFPESG
jgi:hypothetical protein